VLAAAAVWRTFTVNTGKLTRPAALKERGAPIVDGSNIISARRWLSVSGFPAPDSGILEPSNAELASPSNPNQSSISLSN